MTKIIKFLLIFSILPGVATFLLVGWVSCGNVSNVPLDNKVSQGIEEQPTIIPKPIPVSTVELAPTIEPTPVIDEVEKVKSFLLNYNRLTSAVLDVMMWGIFIERSSPNVSIPVTNQNIAIMDLYLIALGQIPDPKLDDPLLANLIIAEVTKTTSYKNLIVEVADALNEDDLYKLNEAFHQLQLFSTRPVAREASRIQDAIITKYNIEYHEVGIAEKPKEDNLSDVIEDKDEEKSQKDLIEELLSPDAHK